MKSLLSALLICFLCCSFYAFGQTDPTLNQVNAKGQKIGKWKGYHKNGAVRYVGNFENDIPQGIFYYYYGDGKLQMKMLHRSENESYATMFYSTGEKLAEGKYTNKQKDSTWVSYGAENKVVEVGNYIKGKREGKWFTYYDSGDVSAEINYSNDEKDGVYIMYYSNGQIKDSSNFENGRLHGFSVIYDSNGDKVLQGMYNLSKRDKQWIYYGENLEVEKVLRYENGKLTNPEDLNNILKNVDKFKNNRKDILEFEDLRGTINYE